MRTEEFQKIIAEKLGKDRQNIYQLAVKMMTDGANIIHLMAPVITGKPKREIDKESLLSNAAQLMTRIAMICNKTGNSMMLLNHFTGEIETNNHFLCDLDFAVSLQMDAAAFYDTMLDRRVKIEHEVYRFQFDFLEMEGQLDRDQMYHLRHIYENMVCLLKFENIPLEDAFEKAVWAAKNVCKILD